MTQNLDNFVKTKLLELEQKQLLRTLSPISPKTTNIVYKNNKKLISFASNDYLCLSSHPSIKAAAIKAIEKYGTGAGSSRLISGNNELYQELENKIANYYNTEAALVFSSGYLANIGVISSLIDHNDIAVADKLIHASLIDGISLSKSKFCRFLHNDIQHLEEILNLQRSLYKNCLVVIESIYSMDGDIAPIHQIIEISKSNNSWILVDNSHGFGIYDLSASKPDIYIGTLSKSLGTLGGYVCASKSVIEYITTKARSFIYTTALPPAVLASAIAALELVDQYKNIPIELAQYFCHSLNLPSPQTNIVTINTKDINHLLESQRTLEDNGFLVAAVRPPTVPTPRLRFSFNANHKVHDIDTLCNIVRDLQKN